MTRSPLMCSAALLSVLLVACAGAPGQQVEVGGGATDGPSPSPQAVAPGAVEGSAAEDVPSGEATSGGAIAGGGTGSLPPAVAQAVLGEHLDDWFVWQTMAWDNPFLPRCDQLSGSADACGRARDVAASAEAGELVVLGPSEPEDLTIELLVQGISQLVVVLPDEAAAAQLSDSVREVVVGWGAEARDLSFGDGAWAADHFDTAPGGFAEIDPNLATRMVVVHEGRTVVVLSHADTPDSPRLDTEPIARDIAQRLDEAE